MSDLRVPKRSVRPGLPPRSWAVRPAVRLVDLAGAVRELDGEPLGRFRRHLRQDVRHPARVHLARHLDQDRRSSRSKIFAASFAFMFSYMVTRLLNARPPPRPSWRCAGEARFHLLELPAAALRCASPPPSAGCRAVELARARFQLLAALLQALEHRALARRHAGRGCVDRPAPPACSVGGAPCCDWSVRGRLLRVSPALGGLPRPSR